MSQHDVSVDIVIPVYKGFAETRRCLSSVISSPLQTGYELVVVNDASPDPEIDDYLVKLSIAGKITLLRNEHNQGFVRSVNLGMTLHPERDVVLLNSDTEVANDWLDRLYRCAYAEQDIGTATPFSNNATICSYPEFCRENALPNGMSLAEIDAVFSGVNAHRWIELPTAVGFCMFIRRSCLNDVGLFDDVQFGRGYGEENDFSLRAKKAGWKNVLCADVFIYHFGSVSFGSERGGLQQSGQIALRRLHPEYEQIVRQFVAADPARDMRLSISLELAKRHRFGIPSPVSMATSRQDISANPIRLHVMHDLGGGAEKWLEVFCAGDLGANNLVLRPFTCSQVVAEGFALYQPSFSTDQPIRTWRLSKVIDCIDVVHDEYRKILASLIVEFEVQEILVSSLIGHSLDALDTGLPTTVISHDYFPYCPAINLYFGEVCRSCDEDKLTRCFSQNPELNPFVNFLPAARKATRDRFMELLIKPNVVMVTPSNSVASNFQRIDKRFQGVFTVTIPHGVSNLLQPVEGARHNPNGRLRVLVLGQLSVVKGVNLLSEALDALLSFADVYLVGCRELGEMFSYRRGVSVTPNFTRQELPDMVARIDPHVGLLLSICPESYSYVLGELMMLRVPPLATRVGSFEERIKHGVNGFLFDPCLDSMLILLKMINENRNMLTDVRGNLAHHHVRREIAMVTDYQRIRPCGIQEVEEQHWIVNKPFPDNVDVHADQGEIRRNRDLWHSLKSLNLQLSICRLARDAAEKKLAAEVIENPNSIPPIDNDIGHLKSSLVYEKNRANAFEAQLREIYSSRAWALLAPLRMLGRARRNLGLLKNGLDIVVNQPRSLPRYLQRTREIFRSDGFTGVKRAILRRRSTSKQQDAWNAYRQNFKQEVRPKILAQLAEMSSRPLISIIVPTFNTPESMLREMLDSVVTQLYPNWELCIADDGSDQPNVRKILRDYADSDKRIKLALGVVNKGVSHASNVALGLCSAEFVVLLDHDDILEAHALFRVAQSICEDGPDMLYSDEVLVTEDARKAKQFIYRPTFSPEYLRGHPYIVHMVGFRKSLLLDVGGFDEQLTISQDYDLILRASERSRTIVHIPDILYRWRIHENSAGHQKMSQVMATSSQILEKHLQRCGEVGSVGEGAGFNLFDIRYPLDPTIRVAIVIPTKNHGDLLRQCIDSIRVSVFGVRYDLIVIDHESDDPETIRYLAAFETTARVLRYEGQFNFSAMNNWAVRKLAGSYSHILFCNNDIQAITPGWLERMLELGQHAGNAIVGAKLLYPDRKTIQHAGVCVGAYGRAEHYGKFMRLPESHIEPGYQGSLVLNHEVSAVTAACMLVQAGVFETLGGFDESILVGFGDVDLCLRAVDQGYRVIYCAHAELIHHESYTRGVCQQDNHPEDTAKFLDKWKYLLKAGDPYYNPGLSLNDTSWQLAQPLPCTDQIRRRIFSRSNELGKQQLRFSAEDKA